MKIDIDLLNNGRYTSKCIVCDCNITLRDNYCIPCKEELKQ